MKNKHLIQKKNKTTNKDKDQIKILLAKNKENK